MHGPPILRVVFLKVSHERPASWTWCVERTLQAQAFVLSNSPASICRAVVGAPTNPVPKIIARSAALVAREFPYMHDEDTMKNICPSPPCS